MKTEVIEAPWMTKAIRTEIKKRKTLNREKRNCCEEDKKQNEELYRNQKKKVQQLIYSAMQQNELKVTMDIKNDKGRGKKLWDNIEKLTLSYFRTYMYVSHLTCH